MYGLPADFDTSLFIGRRLESVAFAEFSTYLNFDDELTVGVYGELTYRTEIDGSMRIDRPSVRSSALMALVGQSVKECNLVSARQLDLLFEGGALVILSDDSSEYEAFTIGHGQNETIV